MKMILACLLSFAVTVLLGWKVILPALRMSSISRVDFNEIISIDQISSAASTTLVVASMVGWLSTDLSTPRAL